MTTYFQLKSPFFDRIVMGLAVSICVAVLIFAYDCKLKLSSGYNFHSSFHHISIIYFRNLSFRLEY